MTSYWKDTPINKLFFLICVCSYCEQCFFFLTDTTKYYYFLQKLVLKHKNYLSNMPSCQFVNEIYIFTLLGFNKTLILIKDII